MATFRNPMATIATLNCSRLVREVLECAVAWEPEVRFANAGAMVAALREAGDQPTSESVAAGESMWLVTTKARMAPAIPPIATNAPVTTKAPTAPETPFSIRRARADIEANNADAPELMMMTDGKKQQNNDM